MDTAAATNPVRPGEAEQHPLSSHSSNSNIVKVGPQITANELEAMLGSAPPGTTIRLQAGHYTFDDSIRVTRSDVALVGAGSEQTRVTFTDTALSRDSAHGFLFKGVGSAKAGTLLADASEQSRILKLAEDHRLNVGDTVRLWQENDPAFLDDIGDNAWRGSTPLRTSMAKVVSVNGGTLTLDRGVHFDFEAGAANVQRLTTVDNVSLRGLTIDYTLGKPDPGAFTNVMPALNRYRAVEFANSYKAHVSDVQVINAPSLAFEFNRSLEVSADQLRAQGAFNKGAGGNGYAFELRESFDGSYTHLEDSGMRHSLLFASSWSSVGNQAHVSFTDRDINFHGGRDHANVVQVEQSVRQPHTDIMSPTLTINQHGATYGAPTDPDANLVTFEYAVGTRRHDAIPASNTGAYLDGAQGNDTLSGASGADVLRGGRGKDTLAGGGGWDELRYSWDPAAIRANLADGTIIDGWGYTDLVSNVEAVRGSLHGDTLRGGNPNSTIESFSGLAGNDIIDGGESGQDRADYLMDALYGGPNAVRVDLTTGRAVDGFGHNDTLISIEYIRGTAQEDVISGNAAANELTGEAGNDILMGRGGNDILSGGAGRDILAGQGGSDTLVGGADLDVAQYESARSAYALSDQGDTILITADGANDTAMEVERLQFSDGVLAFDTEGTAGQAYRIYKAAFDREPDQKGLGYWVEEMDAGFSLQDVTQGFIDSAEFATLYGTNPSDDAFIAQLYNNVLNRDPDAGGFAYWQDEFASGMTRPGVLASFSESEENKGNVADQIDEGIWFV